MKIKTPKYYTQIKTEDFIFKNFNDNKELKNKGFLFTLLKKQREESVVFYEEKKNDSKKDRFYFIKN